MNPLAIKSFAGLASLFIVMGLLLFGPAGTFDYWQAWAFLCVYFSSAGAITVYLWIRDPKLLERRVRAGPRAETEPQQQLIVWLASVAFIASAIVPALDHRFSWSHVPGGIALTADAGVALGFLIVFFVFRENSFSSATIEIASDQTVVSTGPYAVVRHPMYSGALVMLAATPVALGSWWGLLAVVPMLLVIVWRLLLEEAYLVEHLAGYGAYRARVRYRLLPLVW